MQTAKGGHNVRLMDEHIAADHGIERSPIRNRRAEFALRKKHVGAAVGLCASSRGADDVRGTIRPITKPPGPTIWLTAGLAPGLQPACCCRRSCSAAL